MLATTMRTRRSRFFWILLCILGDEQTSYSGIVAVAPRSLALPVITAVSPHEIVWLATDSSCLGMTGNRLYECGDTTLWYMQPIRGSDEEDATASSFELRVVDHMDGEDEEGVTRRERRIRRRTEECLTTTTSSDDGTDVSLKVGPCHADRRWWWKLWKRNRQQAATTVWQLTDGKQLQQGDRCILLGNNHQAQMGSCQDAIVWTFLKAQPQQEDEVSSSTPAVVEVKKPPTEPAMHPELKVQSNLLFQRNSEPNKTHNSRSSTTTTISRPHRTTLRVLTNASPILVAHNNKSQPSAPTPVSKIQRIQTHPYLNSAKHEIWTDPSTSLEFRTDLMNYLGYTNGRHTLTGVGIYRKYVIKVYGVAFYVSKRSLLEHRQMVQFSGLSAEELRKRPDFYELLRSPIHMDRTLLIKTNMQLSAETMRNSLQADWSYLTADAKKLLAETGMQKLPADDDMLRIIQSTSDNPSRCSCMQTAAPEYEANEECCARGTELAFTWTTANALEVRLNGRFMATFDRPDIAQGIFYEYLRYDDPISPELLANVVDGFPFLLAPLNLGIPMPCSSDSQTAEDNHHWLLDHARDQTIEWANAFRKTIAESAARIAKGIGEAASHTMEAFDRRQILQHIVAAPGTLGKIIQRDEETLQAIGRWMSGEKPVIEDVPPLDESSYRTLVRTHHGLDHLRYYYAGDEIGPLKFHPTINRLALILVHFYLLLLFIVSFPGSSYRIIIRKSRGPEHHPEPYERRLYLWKERKGLSYFV